MLGAPPDDQGEDPLDAVQHAIGVLHSLMTTLPDHGDVNQVSGALKLLTGIQSRLMASAQAAQGR